MLCYKPKTMLALRIVTITLVCAFALSGIPSYAITDTTSDFALAPPLATKPPCEIIQKSDGSFDIVTNNDVIESWDRETVKSYGQGVTASGKAFRNRWIFVDVSYLIGQMLTLARLHNLQSPKDILIPLLKKHIQNRNGMAEILLEGFEIDRIEELREGQVITGFALPVTRHDFPAYKLVYNLQSGDMTIPMSDRTNVYVKVESEVGKGTTSTLRLPVVSEPSPPLSARNFVSEETQDVAGQAIRLPVHNEQNPLLYNSWIENLLARRKGSVKQDREYFETFLERDHPLKEEVFSRIDRLSDNEILARLNTRLAPAMAEDVWLWSHTYSIPLGRNLTFEELFLHLTAGDEDVSQIFLTKILFYAEPERINDEVQEGNENGVRRNIEFHYLIFKAMEILSRKSDLVLIRAESLDALTEYLTRYRGAWSASELLSLADLLPPANTPQSQESLRNLLIIIDRLKMQDPQFKKALSTSECQTKIKEIENALKPIVTSVAVDPESERIHTTNFQDAINYNQTQSQTLDGDTAILHALGKNIGCLVVQEVPGVAEKDKKPRPLDEADFSESAEKIKRQLADWHSEYTQLIKEARQKWLEAYPEYREHNMVRISLCLPKDTLQKLDKVDMNMAVKPEEGKVTIIKGNNSYEASLDNHVDIRDFTQAEKIALLAGLPNLPPGEKSMESATAKMRGYFSWWRESLKDFEIRVDWSTDFTAKTSDKQLEVASIYLSQEGRMVYVEQFITNPGFRLTGIGGQFLWRALLEFRERGAVRSSTLRPVWFAEGAREFLGYLRRIGFIVGPFVDKEGEYWFLGKEVTGQDIELAYDPRETENPFLKASEKLLQAMVPPTQDNALAKAFGYVGEAVDVTMRSAGISQYCLYIPYMNEFGEYIFPEDADKKGGLPHIQWVTSSAAGVALKSRHTAPRPLTGEKWIFERLARGELTAGEINALTGDLAYFDSSLGIWYIRDRRALIKLLLRDERFKGSITEEELAIIERDHDEIGPAANTITYQSIYAPTLKEKDGPRLLGIQWFIGELSAFQVEATKSFAFQAGYALERMYLLHSLEARRQERESADTKLSRMKQVVSNIKNLASAFHDLKNKMTSAAGFYKRLVKAGKIAGRDEVRTHTTIERRVKFVMDTLKDSQLKIIELQGHLPPAAPIRSTLILSNVNLAAALIQAASQPQLSNVYSYYLGAVLPTTEEIALIKAYFDSLNTLSELRALTGNLESVYDQTNRIFAAIIGHLNDVLPQLEEYAALPLNEINRLSREGGEDKKTREEAGIILKAISKMPKEINRLNSILGDVVTVEELKEVNLRQLVAEALDEAKSECKAHGIILESKLSDLAKPILIRTKLNALKNFVITELIRNAIKYMPCDKDVKKIEIWTEFKEGNVLLYIQDAGRGMSPEFIQMQLFKKLGAMEDLTGEDVSHISRSGYGLYSARQLMRDLGGDLYVDTKRAAAGEGSTFVIKHPLIPAAPATPETSSAPAVAIMPESERIHATNFQDMLAYIQAQPVSFTSYENKPLIVALGTSWIKGYERNNDGSFMHLQGKDLNELIISIRNCCGSKGISFIDSEDGKLLAMINAEKAKEGMSGAKVIVLADENIVKSNEFAVLRNDEKNAFVVGVNSQELTTKSYIRLMEMLTLALKLSVGLEISQDATPIKIMKDDKLHIYILIPPAQPMRYEEQKAIYEVLRFV